jgi:hypothetical protein
MSQITWLLRSLSVSAIVASVTVGIALGATNVLVNHVHWLGAYLIACPARGGSEPGRLSLPARENTAINSSSSPVTNDDPPLPDLQATGTDASSTAQ